LNNHTEAIFIADAASFIIGANLYDQISWEAEVALRRRFRIVSCIHERVGDSNWSDEWYVLKLAYPAGAEIPHNSTEHSRTASTVRFIAAPWTWS